MWNQGLNEIKNKKGSDPKVPEKEPRDGEEKHVNIMSGASVDMVSLAKRRMVKRISVHMPIPKYVVNCSNMV